MARLHEKNGLLEDARACATRTLACYEAWYPPSHPQVATALQECGRLAFGARDHAAALPLLSRAASIRGASLGASHPYTLEARLHTARCLSALPAGRRGAARGPGDPPMEAVRIPVGGARVTCAAPRTAARLPLLLRPRRGARPRRAARRRRPRRRVRMCRRPRRRRHLKRGGARGGARSQRGLLIVGP